MPSSSLAIARSLDSQDPLARFRAEFVIADPNLVYLDGNSLGRMPRRTPGMLQAQVESAWGERLIRSWGEGWYEAPRRIGEKIALLVGAAPGQVVVTDSTSVDLFKLVLAALELRPGRSKVISDSLNFPTDLYVLQGCLRLLGNRHTLEVIPSRDSLAPNLDKLYQSIDETTALVTLSQVAFKSGYLYAAAEVTRRAHDVGALVLWDLCHSAGAVPVALDEWGADFAVGCTYKYLNGGPGSPAFLYVRAGIQELVSSPIWGWFGEHNPFAFDLNYAPAAGIRRFLCGTPPMLSLQAIEPGVDLLLVAGIEALRQKSIALGQFLIELFDSELAPLGYELGSPRQPEQRGSHVSLRHAEGYRINRALIEELGVLPDFREPDNIRLGLAPLYTSFEDVYIGISRLRQAVVEKRYEHYSPNRLIVT